MKSRDFAKLILKLFKIFKNEFSTYFIILKYIRILKNNKNNSKKFNNNLNNLEAFLNNYFNKKGAF